MTNIADGVPWCIGKLAQLKVIYHSGERQIKSSVKASRRETR